MIMRLYDKDMENKINKRKFSGVVVSAGMNKTVVVKVDMKKLHPKYQKQYLVSKKYQVHDEKSQAKLGDTVNFVECRPLSKRKRWRFVDTQDFASIQ